MKFRKCQNPCLLDTPMGHRKIFTVPNLCILLFLMLSLLPVLASECHNCEVIVEDRAFQGIVGDTKDTQTFSIKPSADLVMDYSSSKGAYSDGSQSSQLKMRSSRVGASIKFNKKLSADLAVDIDIYAKRYIALHSLEFEFDMGKKRDLTFGWMKQPFGLEKSTSSKHLRTLERSMASDLFSPERAVGFSFQTSVSKFYFSSGIFTDNNSPENASFSGRFVWNPVKSKSTVLHLGVSANHQLLSSNEYQKKSDGAVHDGENIISIKDITPESASTIGLESAWVIGSLAFQAEWMVQQLTLANEEKSPRMAGGYMQASWVFFNGRRKYSKGKFKKLTSQAGHSPTEIVFGYGHVDARYDGGGALAKEASITVNRYLNKQVRLAAQLTNVEREHSAAVEKDKGSSLLVRLQTKF